MLMIRQQYGDRVQGEHYQQVYFDVALDNELLQLSGICPKMI